MGASAPSKEDATNAAKSGVETGQEGLATGGYANPHSMLFLLGQPDTYRRGIVKDVTAPVPVVGGITEGLGNAPIAKKIGGVEEEKGYLGQAYEYADGAVRTVYDAAGNAVRSINHALIY